MACQLVLIFTQRERRMNETRKLAAIVVADVVGFMPAISER
jgi:hypothetical protein